MSSLTTDRAGRLPLVVLVLTAGTFLMGTTEFVVAGLLPEMAGDLGVSISQAGLLITALAVGMIVGSPVMAIATTITAATVLLLLAVLSNSAAMTVILVLLMGLTGFAVNPVVTALAVRFAGNAPTR